MVTRTVISTKPGVRWPGDLHPIPVGLIFISEGLIKFNRKFLFTVKAIIVVKLNYQSILRPNRV